MMLASGFFTAPTVATLTGGAVGSLIAVVGAFFVARFTVRVEHQRDQRAAAREAERQDTQDRHAVAAALQRVLTALEAETRAAPFLAGRTQRAMLDAVIEGHRIASQGHPHVAAWLLVQHAELASLSNWSYRAMFWPGLSGQYKRYAERLARVLGDVQAWAIGQRDDQWFSDDVVGHQTLTGRIGQNQLDAIVPIRCS